MGEATFRTETRPLPGVPNAGEIAIRGRVTYEEAPDLRKRILDELARPPASRVVVELSGVEAMDTSGAAVLAEALKAGERRGLRVLLCSPSESVLRIFRLAGFEDVLRCCCTDPEETRRRLTE